MISAKFKGYPAVILGTGPSLTNQADKIRELRKQGKIRVFGVNNTFNDFDLDVWIACDPSWHEHYGQITGDFDKYHWDEDICQIYGYEYIEGRWGKGLNRCDGLSLDPSYIAYGHSSGFQALGLAVHYGCDPIYLAGFDMSYDGGARHYFEGLSDQTGEYPGNLRKYSTFDGLLQCYEQVAKQKGLPKIINLTHSSAFRGFEFGRLEQ